MGLRDSDKVEICLFFFLIALKITAKCRLFRNCSKGGISLKTKNTCIFFFSQQLVYFYLEDLVNDVTDCVSIFVLTGSKLRGLFVCPH